MEIWIHISTGIYSHGMILNPIPLSHPSTHAAEFENHRIDPETARHLGNMIKGNLAI
jgi:hypothetical protein